MRLEIHPPASADFPDWLVLWDMNNLGQRDEAVTAETWSRLLDPASGVNGLGAFETDTGRMVGLVHYILHPTTGSVHPVCYMQDVFTHPDYRGQGVARAMIEHLAARGRAQKWARMQWFAEARNEAAQALYKTLGVKLDFTLHVMPLG